MATLGIDFGSSYTTVSWINPKHGRPETVKFNGDGSAKYPSVIMGADSGLILGYQALNYLEGVYQIPDETKRFEALANFIPSLKRILAPDGIEIIGDQEYSHNHLLTTFFSQLKELSTKHCGSTVNFDSAVISHPVDFPPSLINMLIEALHSAGFANVQTQIEPIAAVLGYSNDHEIKDDDGILVFDFGGGTIDVAYVKKRFNHLKLLCEPKCDMKCGGQDLDILLYEDLRKKIKVQFNFDISSSGMIDYGILNSCRRLKELFSGSNNFYNVPILIAHDRQIITFDYKLNRESFENIIYQKVTDAINVANMVVEQTRQKGYEINKVLLIGGSSQLTLIHKLLANILPNASIDTCGEKDIAVALGNITEELTVLEDNSNDNNDEKGINEDKTTKEKLDDKSTSLETIKTVGDVVYIHNDDGKLQFEWE